MNNPIQIIVDQRERNREIIEGLKEENLMVKIATLGVGDYAISDRLCIERKTVGDFESSIVDGRLFEQAERIKKAYSSPIMLIEGQFSNLRLGRKAVVGAIVSLYVNYGIEVIRSEGKAETVEIISSIARHENEGKRGEPSLKNGIKANTTKQLQLRIIGNLPGVGPLISASMLRHFGSIRSIANSSKEELTMVDKLGNKKAEKIYNVINEAFVEG
jgi:Fanconi anemia group M protein